jgi:uracil-DNA glycosylase family 4
VDWESTQNDIQTCQRCGTDAVPHLRVPTDDKRKPPWGPLQPVRLYFVSVAPPWGGTYFWDETRRDSVREGVFAALRKPLGVTVTTCREFRELRLFLTPAVKCPSAENDKDHNPSRRAIQHCARFLRAELLAAQPERILALGRLPFESLCSIFGIEAPKQVAQFRKRVLWIRLGAKEVPLSGTYFAGNNRHRGASAIIEDISRLLELSPRNVDA